MTSAKVKVKEDKLLTRGLRPPDPQTPAEGKQIEAYFVDLVCFI